ncbi:hypothetical protein ACP4OV_017908 [Aristida adscensionis]
MGIVKIANGVPAAQSCYRCGDEDLTLDERMLLQSFHGHESDDCEHADADCELAMFKGEICNIPYDLYDLHEVSEILSLETWNLCLTEDDRFHLAAYLPDMDQYDFFITMKELFSGDAMFFGSPLRSFFHKLNSGFYSPEVYQARALLMIFQRRRYYYSLKSFHDCMVGKFGSMDMLSKSSDMSTTFGDCISHHWGYEKRLPRPDLSNPTLPIIIKVEADTSSPLKRAKLMDGTSTAHCSTNHNGAIPGAKSVEMNSMKDHVFHPSCEPRKIIRKLPKGVSKIRPSCACVTDGNEGMHHTPGTILVDELGMQISSFCTTSYAFAPGFPGN